MAKDTLLFKGEVVDLVPTATNKETISSLELLDIINQFRKEIDGKKALQHKNLLAMIRDEFEEEIGQLKIQQSYYINSQNKKQPMFELTYNQAKQVLTRESKQVRKAVIKYIEALENRVTELTNKLSREDDIILTIVHSKDKIERALALSEYKEVITTPLLETIEEQEEVIEIQKPKAEYHDNVLSGEGLYTITKVVKDFKDLSAKKANQILIDHKIIYRQKTQSKKAGKILPRKRTQDKGYMASATRYDAKTDRNYQEYKWTEVGRKFLIEFFQDIGFELIER